MVLDKSHKNQSEKHKFFCIHTSAFVLYFIFFSILFYILMIKNIIHLKSKWHILCYGLLFSLFSLLIPAGRLILHKIVEKQFPPHR